MEAHTTLFLTIVTKALLLKFSDDTPTKVFQRISETKELFGFREQMLMFLQTLYTREKRKRDASPENRSEWPLLSKRLKGVQNILKRSTSAFE